MDTTPGAPMIVPSHRVGANLLPVAIAAGTCTRCGRSTEPGNVWNVCASCTARASQPGASMAAGYHSKARCPACRAPLLGPYYSPSLCPSCQARHAAVVKGKQVPRDRPAPRANPYPVHIPKSASTLTGPSSLVLAYPQVPVLGVLPRLAPPPPVAIPSPSISVLPTALPVVLPSVSNSALPTALPSASTFASPLYNTANPVNAAPSRRTHPPLPPALPSALPSTSASTFAPPLHNVAIAVNAAPSGKTPRTHRSSNYILRLCMRFGCCARLPAHIPGDMCEACMRAGFARPPPAALGQMQQRPVPKRACPRPAEVVSLLRTSIVRGDERGDEIRAEREDVDDESEMELVYPDDVPVATQGSLTSTSVSKTEQSKPVSGEDDELELVYPEEPAETKRPSLPRKRIKVPPPPTTLRELFQGSLRTIPALQNLTSLAMKDPPRPCPSSGCNEMLPAQSGLQRCVKCGIAEWKRRRLASIDTEPPRRHTTTTTSTMEEREVATMLDDMSDVEEENKVPPPSSSPGKDSNNELTGGRGRRPIPGWDSDLTELSSSESSDSDTESTSDSSSESDSKPAQPHGELTGFKIRIPLLVTHLPPGSSFQKCANKRCHIALPKDHRWKTCHPCRNAQRMSQRLRLENKRRSLLGIETLESPELYWRRWRSLSPDFDMEMLDMDTSLTPETSLLCAAKHCSNRIPLPEIYRWKTCVRCRAKARHDARRKRDALLETPDSSCDEVVPRFPAYQNRGQLMSSFEAQLNGFAEGQILYYRAKMREERDGREPCRLEKLPMMFVFAGEYSVVTGQRGDRDDTESERPDVRRPGDPDPAKDVEAMRQEVSSVVLELGCVLRAKFRPGEAFAIDKGGIIMRFTCSLELIAQLRPLANASGSGTATATASSGTADSVGDASGGSGPSPASVADPGASASKDDERDKDMDMDALPTATDARPSPPPPIPLVKTLTGELEAVVLPDESHRLLHGRRTVIRYRMVG